MLMWYGAECNLVAQKAREETQGEEDAGKDKSPIRTTFGFMSRKVGIWRNEPVLT